MGFLFLVKYIGSGTLMYNFGFHEKLICIRIKLYFPRPEGIINLIIMDITLPEEHTVLNP